MRVILAPSATAPRPLASAFGTAGSARWNLHLRTRALTLSPGTLDMPVALEWVTSMATASIEEVVATPIGGFLNTRATGHVKVKRRETHDIDASSGIAGLSAAAAVTALSALLRYRRWAPAAPMA